MSACNCPCPECGPGITASSDHPMMHITGVRYHAGTMDAAQAETRRLKAALDAAQDEIAMLRRGGETLGKIIDRQGRELIELTNSQDVIGDDGDGDWQVVWDRLHEMKRALDVAQDEIERRIHEAEEARPIVEAARAEQAAERQLVTWQATLLTFGGMSWGPLNPILLDAAIEYLSDCRDERRAVLGGAR